MALYVINVRNVRMSKVYDRKCDSDTKKSCVTTASEKPTVK